MLGRGAVVDPGLGLAIKAEMAGECDFVPLAWLTLVLLIAEFWHIVCTRLDARSRAGRLKQWLNFLRRRFPEAEEAYQALKRVNDPAAVDVWLAGVLANATEATVYCARIGPPDCNFTAAGKPPSVPPSVLN